MTGDRLRDIVTGKPFWAEMEKGDYHLFAYAASTPGLSPK